MSETDATKMFELAIENAVSRKEPAKHEEGSISVNGVELTVGQSMTVRVALSAFLLDLQDGLGEDPHGRFMTQAYRDHCSTILDLLVRSAVNADR